VSKISLNTPLTKSQIQTTEHSINSIHEEYVDLKKITPLGTRFGGTKRKKWGRPPF
jgi:hypothetical protein